MDSRKDKFLAIFCASWLLANLAAYFSIGEWALLLSNGLFVAAFAYITFSKRIMNWLNKENRNE